MRSKPFSTHFVLLSLVWSLAIRVISLPQLSSLMVPWPAGVSQLCAPWSPPIPQTWPLSGSQHWSSIISQNKLPNHLQAQCAIILHIFSFPQLWPLPSQCLLCTAELKDFSIWKAYHKHCSGRVRLFSSLKQVIYFEIRKIKWKLNNNLMSRQNWVFICNTYPEVGNLYQSRATIFWSSFTTLFATHCKHCTH